MTKRELQVELDQALKMNAWQATELNKLRLALMATQQRMQLLNGDWTKICKKLAERL